MTRSTLLIALISTLLTIIYLVLAYMGIIRYFTLYNQDMEPYLSAYNSLPYADKNRVVISMAVTEKDLKKRKFLHTTKSLLDQTVRVNEIALLIPYSKMGLVTPEMKKVYAVYGYSKNYGSEANLVNAILREPDSRTKIILVQPNYIYDREFVQDILKEGAKINYEQPIVYKEAVLVTPNQFDDKISLYEKASGLQDCLNQCSNCKCKKGFSFYNWPALLG